jgi:hypothetical protein
MVLLFDRFEIGFFRLPFANVDILPSLKEGDSYCIQLDS